MTLMENAQLLGSFGEFFGSIAVVTTLVYLAVQVRETRKVAMAQAYQGRAMMRQQGHLVTADSNHLAPLLGRLRDAGWPESPNAVEDLSSEDKERIGEYIVQTLVHLDNVLYQQELGLMDQNLTESVRSAVDGYRQTLNMIGRAPALPPRISRLVNEPVSAERRP